MGEYTEKKEDEVFGFAELFDNEDYDEDLLLDYLQQEFQPFNISFRRFIQRKMPKDKNLTPEEYFKECQIRKSITALKKSTCSNWFKSGKRPKKGVDSRAKLFAIAFILELTVEETAELFHKVFLDRAFNARDYKEVIYYYCLLHKRTYDEANYLIRQVSFNHNQEADEIVYTSIIQSDIERIPDDMQLLVYINNHPQNFSLNNYRAKQILEDLMDESHSFVQKEIAAIGLSDGFKYKNLNSNSLMYEIITGQKVSEKTGTGTKTIFKNTYFPQEIKTNFPERMTFSKKDPSYEELRKMIVLLKSYCFWSNAKAYENFDFYDDYVDEMNAMLSDAGFSVLYSGNPFDWLFLFCSSLEEPLDKFRSVLNEAMNHTDE